MRRIFDTDERIIWSGKAYVKEHPIFDKNIFIPFTLIISFIISFLFMLIIITFSCQIENITPFFLILVFAGVIFSIIIFYFYIIILISKKKSRNSLKNVNYFIKHFYQIFP